jgi:hypothetical protein
MRSTFVPTSWFEFYDKQAYAGSKEKNADFSYALTFYLPGSVSNEQSPSLACVDLRAPIEILLSTTRQVALMNSSDIICVCR